MPPGLTAEEVVAGFDELADTLRDLFQEDAWQKCTDVELLRGGMRKLDRLINSAQRSRHSVWHLIALEAVKQQRQPE